MTKVYKPTEEAVRYCLGCVKFDRKNIKCIVFLELFPDWGSTESRCWGRVEDPQEWVRTLSEIEDYFESQGRDAPVNVLRDKFYAEKKVEANRNYEGLEEVYGGEVKKQLRKPPRGEKTDRVHKLFPRERMKDNRYIPPWEGF